MTRSGFISIVGRPNAGKSTLLNTILGSKVSIVTPKAQTTREQVLGILTEKQGQIVFVDTPGIHRAKKGGLNEAMMGQVSEALEAPHLIWYVVDPSSALEHEAAVLELLEGCPSPVILLLNKIDAVRSKAFEERLNAFEEELRVAMGERKIHLATSLRISAKEEKGLDSLLEMSWGALPEGPLYFSDPDQLSDRPTRYFVAERIREQLLLRLGEEIPYSCAVEIGTFQEPTAEGKGNGLTRIEATIHVERESQKGIVIGKGGAKIKEIGQAARQEIEAFIGTPVFLGLKVKVLREWTRQAEALNRLGYHLPEGPKKHRNKPQGKRS